MGYLLDTHTFLWFAENSKELPASIRAIIEIPLNVIAISIASFWEIGIKSSIGKLPLARSIVSLGRLAEAEGMTIVPIEMEAVEKIAQLPWHHKDPFDRIIAATALTTGDMLLSADPIFDAYGVQRMWK